MANQVRSTSPHPQQGSGSHLQLLQGSQQPQVGDPGVQLPLTPRRAAYRDFFLSHGGRDAVPQDEPGPLPTSALTLPKIWGRTPTDPVARKRGMYLSLLAREKKPHDRTELGLLGAIRSYETVPPSDDSREELEYGLQDFRRVKQALLDERNIAMGNPGLDDLRLCPSDAPLFLETACPLPGMDAAEPVETAIPILRRQLLTATTLWNAAANADLGGLEAKESGPVICVQAKSPQLNLLIEAASRFASAYRTTKARPEIEGLLFAGTEGNAETFKGAILTPVIKAHEVAERLAQQSALRPEWSQGWKTRQRDGLHASFADVLDNPDVIRNASSDLSTP